MARKVWSHRYANRMINVGRLAVVFRGEYAELPDWAIPEYNWLVTHVPGVRPAPPPPPEPASAPEVALPPPEAPPPAPEVIAAPPVEEPAPRDEPAAAPPPDPDPPKSPMPAEPDPAEPSRRGRRPR